ncbi:MAG: response regulator [Candidatus Hydrogenedentes bacterium]|nr:response regulator [Candidatus Hydrogenedentota bacterium]
MNKAPVRVLVVDDEERLRRSLVSFMEDEGFQVFSASSGEEALAMLPDTPVDVGIIDMRLTGMDGNDFIVAAHQAIPTMRFLIFTGSSDYRIPAVLRAIGIDQEHLFRKPLPDMGVLAEAVRREYRAGIGGCE